MDTSNLDKIYKDYLAMKKAILDILGEAGFEGLPDDKQKALYLSVGLNSDGIPLG